MKSAFLFLVFLVAASATYVTDSVRGKDVGTTFGDRFGSTVHEKTADKQFLTRNKDILRLLNHINTVNTNVDQRAIGKDFHVESNIDKFTNLAAVKDFIRMYKFGMLPKGKIFSINNEKHMIEVVSLFHMFFYAKDFDTFYRCACWARDHVNEGMFVYAMTVAVIHRADTRGMKLPPPYEIYPFYFFNTEVIQKAVTLKMQERVVDDKMANFLGVRQVDNTFYIKSNYSGWYTQANEDNLLTYFTEDIDLNTYYFYFHATYPFWMGSEEFGMTKDRRGEFMLYTHQQILARYYMERLSNNMDEIPKFMWTKPIKTGFMSNLRHHNGLDMPSRPNHFTMFTEDNLWDLTEVTDYERRIRDAVDSGFIISEDGRKLSLNKPEDIELLGNIMESNKDCPNTRYYILGALTAKKLLGNGDDLVNDYFTHPTVLEQFETALRDPMFYQLTKKIMFNYMKFKETLRPYTRDELVFPGVKIEDVNVDKLVTFFDMVDVDITNAVSRKVEEMEQNREQFVFKTIQRRLNHNAFNVKLDISSDKSTEAVVRIFLGPKYDSMKNKLNLNENKENFFELDFFVYNLKTGKNTIMRNSRDFMTTIEDRTPARELLRKITTCINGNEECLVDKTMSHIGFPDRLLLPKGKKAGMLFNLYVVITPLRQSNVYSNLDTQRNGKVSSTGSSMKVVDFMTNIRLIDDNAFGYPLDRPIDMSVFWNTNMFMTEVMIFHKTDMNMSYNKDSDMYTKDVMDRTVDMDTMDRTYDRDLSRFDSVHTMDKNTMDRTHDMY